MCPLRLGPADVDPCPALAHDPGSMLGARRGYLRFDLTPQRLQADLMAMERFDTRDTPRRMLAQFVVEDGVAGPVPA